MKKIIKNFTESQELRCEVNIGGSTPTVCLLNYGGAMSFHFHMTPDQARELGAVLYQLADSLDAEPLTKEAA